MKEFGITSYRLAKEIGCTTTSVTNWLSGKDVSKTYITRMADYFQVSIDFLLGETDIKKAPTLEGERSITYNDFIYAMQNEAKGLTEMDKQILLSMAKQLKEARKQKDVASG